jgi:hypothetical protein
VPLSGLATPRPRVGTGARAAGGIPVSRPHGGADWARFGPDLLAFGALAVWAGSLSAIDLDRLTDIGVLPVLPPSIFVAVALLAGSFALALRQARPSPVRLLLHVVALIVLVQGTLALVEGTPARPDAWRHLGLVEYVQRHGSVDPGFTAYFGWPSFFILSAFAFDVLGLKDGTGPAVWAPMIFNLAYLGPLLLILRSATPDSRLPWLGVWCFYLTDWVGQDYYAPQALAYLLHLVIVGILLTWFTVAPGPLAASMQRWLGRLRLTPRAGSVSWAIVPTRARPDVSARPGLGVGLLAVVLILFSVVVSGHQLTPFFTLSSVTMLVAFRLCTLRSLPLIMFVMISAWILYMAWAFFSNNVSMVLGSIGRISDTLDANVSERVIGSPGHILVVRTRIAASLLIWIVALIGCMKRSRNGYRDSAMILLALSPFLLLPLQGYGGEMIMRIYVFALPAMLFFACTLLHVGSGGRPSWRTTAATAIISVGLFGLLLITRYGDERVNHMTVGEIEAVRYVYRVAAPGSLLVAAGPNTSWQFQDVDEYTYAEFGLKSAEDLAALRNADLDAVERKMEAGSSTPAYLIVTRSQAAALEDVAGLPAGTVQRLVARLTSSGRFRALFSNHDAAVFRLADAHRDTAR